MKKNSKIGLLALLLALACTLALLPTAAFAAGNGGEEPSGEATGTWDEDTQASNGHFLMAVPSSKAAEGQGGWSIDDFDDGSAHIVMDDKGTWLVMGPGSNPEYTVGYYAQLPVVYKSEYGGDLAVIDTSADASGPRLPRNGNPSNPGTDLMGLMLESDGTVVTELGFLPIYDDETWEYQDDPRAVQIDKVSSGGEANYELVEISVEDGEGWQTYTVAGMAQRQGMRARAIGWSQPVEPSFKFECPVSGSNIQLVYEPVGSDGNRTGTFPASFYDYDITDDGVTTGYKPWGSTSESDITHGYGINSPRNYMTDGAVFAFGNANSGTGLWLKEWSGNKLNMYNDNSYMGCTFGLADSLRADGTIRYSDGVSVQNLFNERGYASGKTECPGGSLTFRQVGDT